MTSARPCRAAASWSAVSPWRSERSRRCARPGRAARRAGGRLLRRAGRRAIGVDLFTSSAGSPLRSAARPAVVLAPRGYLVQNRTLVGLPGRRAVHVDVVF